MRQIIIILILLGTVSCKFEPAPAFLGIVSSASPEATQAGFEILEKGGNAIDAAVAVSFALGVTEPAMSGLGGGSQVLLALPGQKPIAINGATISPAATPVDAVEADLTYHRRSTIPSTVKVLEYSWKKFGSGAISWPELLAPAIRYAEEGFAVGTFRHLVYKKYESTLKNSPHHARFFLLPKGEIPGPGDTLKQPVLAKTMRRLAEKGAADFYQGEIARKIAADMEANNGWISFDDLENFPGPVELDPVHTSYRGYEVYSQPPPCGGWTALLALNILENASESSLQFETESRMNSLLKALHLAHRDRKENPVTDMVNYQQLVFEKLDKSYATALLENYQPPATHLQKEEKGGETTHFSVVDNDGMAVAVTASINAYFGAAAASPDLGFLYNTYMNDFILGDTEHPFSIGPGKMNYSSMSPTIIQREGKTELVLGSPGSARIISAVAQISQLWMDTEMSIEEVVFAPRFHSVNNKVFYEDHTVPKEWINKFRNQGFEVTFPSYDLTIGERNAYFGGVHAIARENNQWIGVADPRRDGLVLGNLNKVH